MVSSSSALLLLAAAVSVSAGRVSPSALRALEENGYQYMEDLTAYQMQFGRCVRVKVPDEGDDDGNSYFYNGHYYTQGMQFASVYLCDSYSADSENQCGVCDTSKEYVTDLATYLETSLEFAARMCESCEAQCYNRRKLEDGEEEEEEREDQEWMNVNCNTCVNTCSKMNFNYNNGDEDEDENQENNVYDETQYLECQEAFQDENGIQIYAGPQCNSDGDIVIGFYYDDECMVKSSSASMGFGFQYDTFRGLQNICLSCNAYGNGEDDVCQELYEEATHCSNGKDLTGEEEDMPICKTYEKAHQVHHYGKRRRDWRLAEIIIAVVVVGGFFWAFLTLSWTYYLRHRAHKASAKVPLTKEDHISEPEIMITPKTMT